MIIVDGIKNLFGDGRFQRFLKRPISYRTVSGILVVTILSTLLFWKAQSMEVQDNSTVIFNLSEFKYFDATLDRHMQAARGFQRLDSLQLISTLAVLLDLGKNLNEYTLGQIERGGWVPDSLSGAIDGELRARIFQARLLMRERARLGLQIDSLLKRPGISPSQVDSLWKIRQGWTPIVSDPQSDIQNLMVIASRQNAAFENFGRQKMQMLADDMIRTYQAEMRKNLAVKDAINGAFYVLSILALLVVVVLLVRIRR